MENQIDLIEVGKTFLIGLGWVVGVVGTMVGVWAVRSLKGLDNKETQ